MLNFLKFLFLALVVILDGRWRCHN